MSVDAKDSVRLPIKVHRVATVEEAQSLDNAGVDYIGFHVDEDAVLGIDASPFWADDRYLLLDQLPELLGTVTHARPFVECHPDIVDDVVEVMLAYGVSLLQVNSYFLSSSTGIVAQKQNQIEVIYGHHYIVPGDEPRFLDLSARTWPNLFALDLQIFPSETDAWNLLSAPSPEVAQDIVKLSDIAALATAIPLFVSLNYSQENCTSIEKTFSELSIKGLSLTLSPSKYGSFHTYEFQELLPIVQALRKPTL